MLIKQHFLLDCKYLNIPFRIAQYVNTLKPSHLH